MRGLNARDEHRSWWDRTAWAYDLQARFERPALDCSVRLADVDAGDRVLDAGCGTGQWLRQLAASGVTPARLVGVDQSARMLDHARGLGAELVRADVRALPFADASFDVVCVAYVLHLLDDSDVPIVLSEIHRILAPDGRLVTITPWPAAGLPGRVQRALAECTASTLRSWTVTLRPLDPTAALDDAGFRVDATVDVQQGYQSRCVRAIVEPQ